MTLQAEEILFSAYLQNNFELRSENYGNQLGSMEVLIGGMGRRA
jgi:hypothetical protein